MNEAVEHSATSILLPNSTVAVYSRDQETLQAARDLEKDWRFARVRLQVDEGDLDTAIDAYKEIRSPDLVILQTGDIGEGLTEKLGELAGHCEEGTAAIVIGPVNDVYLYRELIEMGISDYLVRPVKTSILAEVIAKTLIEKKGVTGSRLVAFIGAKGGVGTSALAQAAAGGIARKIDQKTVLLDACGGWSSLSVGLGFEPATTLAEAARAAENKDEDSLKRMLFRPDDKLCVLASGGDVMMEAPVTPEHYEDLLDMLMVKYPVVVADLSGAGADLKQVVCARANQIVVVSTPVPAALRLARSLIHEIKDIRGGLDDDIDLVVNMAGLAPASEVKKSDLEQAMDFKVSATVSFDPVLFTGNECEGKMLIDDKDGHALVTGTLLPVLGKVLNMDGVISEETPEKTGFLDGFLAKIKSRA